MDNKKQKYPQKESSAIRLLDKWDSVVEPFCNVKWVKSSEDGNRLVISGR